MAPLHLVSLTPHLHPGLPAVAAPSPGLVLGRAQVTSSERLLCLLLEAHGLLGQEERKGEKKGDCLTWDFYLQTLKK